MVSKEITHHNIPGVLYPHFKAALVLTFMVGISMANTVAGTRSQPPTISTMVFVSRNCRLANSISQHHGPLACRIRRLYPILNPHTGHNLQLLANDGPSFTRKQVARDPRCFGFCPSRGDTIIFAAPSKKFQKPSSPENRGFVSQLLVSIYVAKA